MEVVNINDSNYKKVETFLSSVEGINIDKEVLKNASVLMEEDEIIGIISFECFGKSALIRYFIFKKVIDETSLLKLFNGLISKAEEKKISKIIGFVNNKDTTPLFEFLGFKQIDKRSIYIEEKKFVDSKNKDAYVYCYEIMP